MDEIYDSGDVLGSPPKNARKRVTVCTMTNHATDCLSCGTDRHNYHTTIPVRERQLTWLVSNVARQSPLGFMNRMPVSGDPQAQVATTIHCSQCQYGTASKERQPFEGCTEADRLSSRQPNTCALVVALGIMLSSSKNTTTVFLFATAPYRKMQHVFHAVNALQPH